METNDLYLWLEDVHGAEAIAWVKRQNAESLAVLQADPDYPKNYDSLLNVLDAPDRIPFGAIDHDSVFNFWQDADHPKGIWRRTTIVDYANVEPRWDVLLDLDKLAADEHENWVWKSADFTPSQLRCLISLSRGGGDAVVTREFDLTSKSFVTDGFTLPEAKTRITWLDEDTVLFGTYFGPGSMTASGYPRVVKIWKRGQPMTDAKTLFEGQISDVAMNGAVYHGPYGNLAIIQRSITFFTSEFFYLQPDGTTVKLPLPLGADVKGVSQDNLIFTLRDDWTFDGASFHKGALLAIRLEAVKAAQANAKVAVLYMPDARSSVEAVATGRDAIYASIFSNVTGSIHAFRADMDGAWTETILPLPAGGSTAIVTANDWGPEAQFCFESFLMPTTLYMDKGDNKPVVIKSLPARFDASNLATRQSFAISKDGTEIPYFVTGPKTLSGAVPTVLYGYGGFAVSLVPAYSANFGMLWLDRGGVFVVANIRGGGEFGPGWHQAARKENRQKAYDDFQAVAEDLIRRGITTPAQLGIMGGSNGGLLVSANMVERPDLFGAVVCQVPLIDMIRYTRIGAGASWEAEYGDPADPAARAWILKYSPYQNVSAGKTYPPVLFVTATSDDRVTPVHARKMAARMEAQGHDVLFYENTDGGHAAAADHKQSAEMWALSFVYLKQKLDPAASST